MPSLVAISQATTEINRGAESAPPQALSVSNRPGQIGLNIAVEEEYFARMKKLSPKIVQVSMCLKFCTNFDSNSGKMRAGKAFYGKLKGVALRFLCYPCPNHLPNFHRAMSECTGLLQGLCETVREIINSIAMLKLLKEKYPVAGFLGSMDDEILPLE